MNLLNLSFIVALASTGAGTSTLEPAITAMSTLVDLMGKVFDVMLANPLLVLFLASGLFSLGFRLFRKAKRAAKG